jgi:hypothetical protein
VTEQQKWGLAGLAVGAALTGAVIYVASTKDNEDRPPMVVKGGSLIIQSGFNSKKPGKPWHNDPNAANEWQMDHSAGKQTNAFLVMMSGSGSCGPDFVDDMILEYTLSSNQAVQQFRVTRKKQIGSSGNKMVPTVIGERLTPTNSGDTPFLMFPDAGELTRVTAAGIDCRSPGAFAIHPTK